MKANLMILAGCLTILMSGSVFAACCQTVAKTCGQECEVCSECQCTDYGYRYNTCMTKERYCEAFGNVGGR